MAKRQTNTARAVAQRTGRVEALLSKAEGEAESLGVATGEEAILAVIADVGALGKVAEHFGTNRAAVQAWIRTDPERIRPLVKEARRFAADMAAEEAGEVLDDVPDEPTSAQVSLANSKSNFKRWLAGMWSEDYKDQKGQVNVALNFGDLHLDVLREEGVRRGPVLVASVPAEEDAEPVEATWEEEEG